MLYLDLKTSDFNILNIIGRFFAIQEIMMSLIYLLKHYDIDTASGKKPHPVSSIANIHVTNCEEPLIFTPKN